ncbi:dihydroxyacetone kinase subunit DhaK [Streptomyces rapamycinicus]|uniref:Dihydroxyacetone kinase n=2 Tax=Streptomyces rapamycinicus TaxID=1226757 RepID=A0A0A0NSU5_STRRN|nr:dihydroxyacetone kinase subunit DhaK [Streptomyces rapamycinicus]AGP59433.1 dihydroxyacetone kinase [Streptomyces rapamycinicus NRRL 5491]MBB4787187.1 dihydroxyacetone kinase-like protein [Streptomyces rapamycinicus]RLV77375.1 dihydroxyacetone kinase [Streptomyces rapamycinicus NRRL 5491]UTO67148.1 dihydroxyacetone kinase subunit DhaK [Streptomyces rapamycinicus]UTP35105.1 dihydroxyacetone kinase subunit DhaK [Streptomyces rapamycinicus NRRL 5491]
MPRYFADSAESIVADALAGFASAHADLVSHHPDHGYLRTRNRSPERRVGLVSGGGSGHEPLHAGFIGAGMLDAACPGRIFASPHNRQIFEASRAVAGPGGVLHIVKNYTGDRINFGIAAERLAHEQIPCARVLVDDDLATDSEDIVVGRRGTGATLIVEKILGAAADEGRGLDELAALGAEVARRSRSLAVASAAHTTPGTGGRAFELPDDVLEFGVGIHGERAEGTTPVMPLGQLVRTMTTRLLAALPDTPRPRVLALVNGLGATTSLELYGIHHALTAALDDTGVALDRSLTGTLVSALDMRGFSLSLLATDDELLRLWDAPARTPAWPL